MLMKITNAGRSWLVLTLLTWSVVTGTALSPAQAQERPVANIKIDIDIEVWEISDSVIKEIDELEAFGGHWMHRIGLLGMLQEQRDKRKQSLPTRFQMKVQDGQASHLNMLNVMMDKAASLHIDLTPTLVGRDEITLDYDMVRRTRQGEIKVSGKPRVKFGNLMTQWIKPKPTDDEENKEKSWLVFVFPRQRNADGNDVVVAVDSQKETNPLGVAYFPRPGRFEMQVTERWAGHLLVNSMGGPGVALSGTTNIGASKDATASDHYVRLATFRAERPVLEVVHTDDGYIQLVARRSGVASVRYQVPGLDGKTATCDLQIVVAPDTTEIDRVIEETFPRAAIKVTHFKDAAMLTGTVAKNDDIALLTEVAEQFYPKIINRVQVVQTSEKASPVRHSLEADVQYVPPASLPVGTMAAERTTAEPQRKLPRRRDAAELKALHDDVRALREDVRRLNELLEKGLVAKDMPQHVPGNGEAVPQTDRRGKWETPIQPNGLLNITNDWCGPCQKMQPLIDKLVREGCPIQTVDIDRDMTLAKRFNVTSIPCIIRLEEGKEVNRVIGLTNEAAIRSLAKFPTEISRALAKPISLHFDNVPLNEVLTAIKNKMNVNFVVDVDSGIELSTPVSINVADVPVHTALDQILKPLQLGFREENDVLKFQRSIPLGDLRISAAGKRAKPVSLLVGQRGELQFAGRIRSVEGHDGSILQLNRVADESLLIQGASEGMTLLHVTLDGIAEPFDVVVIVGRSSQEPARPEGVVLRAGDPNPKMVSLRVNQSLEVTASDWLTRVDGFDPQLVNVTASEKDRLRITGQKVGTTTMTLTTKAGKSHTLEVTVRSAEATKQHPVVRRRIATRADLPELISVPLEGGQLIEFDADISRLAIDSPSENKARQLDSRRVLVIGGQAGLTRFTFWFEKTAEPLELFVLVPPLPGERTSRKDRVPNDLLAQIYPAIDLVIPVADEASGKPTSTSSDLSKLVDLITTTVEPASWKANGGPCSIEVTGFTSNKSLLIRATPKMHESIKELLSTMKADRDVQVVLETRLFQTADSVLEKAGLKDGFDPRTRTARIDERGVKRLVEVIEAEHGEMLIVPKLTFFSSRMAHVGAELRGLDDKMHRFKLYVRGLVAKDSRNVRLDIAPNHPSGLLNDPFGLSHTLKDGGYLLLDMTDLFHLPKPEKPKGRVLILVQPRIVIPEKKDANKVVEDGVNLGSVRSRIIVQEEEEELLGVPAQ